MQEANYRQGCLNKIMINVILKVTYIHPPKTGGWSIISIFGGNSIMPENDWGHEVYPNHYTSEFYARRHTSMANHFVFATTRNPWQRVVSAYCWLTQNGIGARTPTKEDGGKTRHCTFEEYVHWLAEDRINIRHDINNSYWSHPNCVMDYIVARNSVAVDYICEMQTINEDFSYVADVLGMNIKINHMNKTKHNEYKSYYSDKSAEIVRKVFKKDIDYFGYSFDEIYTSKFNRVINQDKINRYKKNKTLYRNGVFKI